MKIKILSVLFILWASSALFAQKPSFQYKRSLTSIHNQWQKIHLPDAVYAHINSDLSDLRIYGITSDKDTIEAAYVWEIPRFPQTKTVYDFKIINQSHTAKGQFFTLKLAESTPINQIHLLLKNTNFDWKIRLEGSPDNHQWFTITDSYRILNISTGQTKYNYTDIHFSTADYPYFRIFIPTSDTVKLINAQIKKNAIQSVLKDSFPVIQSQITQNQKTKQTIINLELATPVPVDFLSFTVSDSFDYYRPIRIEQLTDQSTKNGTFHNIFHTLYKGTLSSLEKSNFRLKRTILQKIRVVIDNGNNQKLSFQNFKLAGTRRDMLVRFTDTTAQYSLYYGNKKLRKPSYDLHYLTKKIPVNPDMITVQNEIKIPKNDTTQTKKSFFNNPIVLWVLMGIIILVLGFFTLKMLQQTS